MRSWIWLYIFLVFIVLSTSTAVAEITEAASGDSSVRVLPPPGGKSAKAGLSERYIIKLEEPPLAAYRGGINRMEATAPPTSGEKVNLQSNAALQYRSYLESRQDAVRAVIENRLDRSLQVLHSYQVAYNGMAVEMSGQEAARVAKMPGVAAVIPDRIRTKQTDRGPGWIGAGDVWGGGAGTPTSGEGIVIGVIDTGINPVNRSFAETGDDLFTHSNPKGKYYGFCDPASTQYDAGFTCNDKLIGGYDFARDSGDPLVIYDDDGHGSHTAGTAGGNQVNNALLDAPTISFNRNISGVAPHANLISYRGLKNGSGKTSWLVAAIDQAVADGVDVINYSIGGGASNPWTDPDAEAFLNARNAGVFVATSAGNNGPGSGTISSPANAPWLLTVGSSSHDREFSASLTGLTRLDGTSLPDIHGKSVSTSLSTAPIVYAGDYSSNGLCAPSVWSAGTFSGQIVVCDRGSYGRVEKGQSVLDAGGGGYILANDAANGYGINSDSHVLPAVHITYNDGVALKNWLAASSSHQGAISATTVDIAPANGDIMSSFSSRGANTLVPGVIKPDVSAPGQDILAAHGTNNEQKWDVESGTSMASPHAAGAAALLIAQQPGWSPVMVQSALMTSVDTTVLKEDGATAADPFDTGNGRIDVSRAALAGLLLDVAGAEYTAADPAAGGDPSALNLPSLAADMAVWDYSWKRTVQSSLATDVTWTATVTNPAGVSLSVSPPLFTLAAGGAQQVTVTADVSSAALGSWLFGGVTFTPNSGQTVSATVPVAIKPVVSNLPTALRLSQEYRQSSTLLSQTRTTMDVSELSSNRYGMTAATLHQESLYQDTTPDYPYDAGPGMVDKRIDVPAGAKRLVTEIVATTAPDIDLYVWRWTGTEWVWICTSASGGSDEYCSTRDPVAGEYHVFVQNWTATDPSGTTADDVTLATAVVPATDGGNLHISTTNGSVIPPGQPFDLQAAWNLPGKDLHWYGAFELGSSSSKPDNIGRVDLDLTHVQENRGTFYIIKGKGGKTTVIRLGN